METMVLCQHMFTTLKLPGYKVAFFIKCNQYLGASRNARAKIIPLRQITHRNR